MRPFLGRFRSLADLHPTSTRSFCMALQRGYKWCTIPRVRFLESDMSATTIKESRLNIRCDNRARQLLDKAAAYTHVSVSNSCSRTPWPRLNKSYRRMSPLP